MPKKRTSGRRIAPPFPPPEHPWERQPGEGDRAWDAFTTYRDLGPGKRSLQLLVDKCHKGHSNFARWSNLWDWVARCTAFDAWMDRQARLIEIEEIRAMKRRHIEFAMSFQGAAALALNKIIEAEKRPRRDANGQVVLGPDGKPLSGELTLRPNEVKELADLGMRIERLNRGEPTEIEASKVEIVRPSLVSDYSALSLDELRTLRDLTRKAKAGSGNDA